MKPKGEKSMKFSEKEKGIILSGLDILKESCDNINRISVHDKIDIKPITKLFKKIENDGKRTGGRKNPSVV